MLKSGLKGSIALFCFFLFGLAPAFAQDWSVAKSTGQVWIANANVQPVALGAEAKLSAGDLIQTGPNGRALLTRGAERIIVGPNSVISLPQQAPENGFTKILQRAGSIAVEAEKKDHLHFEVETPYLAAVVKGTSFTVSIASGSADVHVATGKVEVSNLKTGQSVLVLPNQSAHATPTAFSVRGAGAHEPIRQSPPRGASLTPVVVPKHGLRAPPRGLGQFARIEAVKVRGAGLGNSVRISHAIGPAKLDASAATLGLARGDATTANTSSKSANTTIWSDTNAGSSTSSSSASSSSSNGNANANGNNGNGNSSSNAGGNGVASGGGVASVAAAANAGNGNAGGNGNGNAFGLINGGNGAAVNGHAYGKKK
ncbi:MAG: hypothetical protein EKK41_20525 [Hyphomicrobiales bacterium]|nr:MAG: hypothetical protein EKK41_20525 [Hyphomicrobiales bacterium]